MSFKLECAQSFSSKNTTEADIDRAFDDDAIRGEFIILTASDGSFMQAAGEGDDDYCLEYRDAKSEEHIQVQGKLTKEQVRTAFIAFLSSDSSWRSDRNWEPLKSSGCMSIIIIAISLLTSLMTIVFYANTLH